MGFDYGLCSTGPKYWLARDGVSMTEGFPAAGLFPGCTEGAAPAGLRCGKEVGRLRALSAVLASLPTSPGALRGAERRATEPGGWGAAERVRQPPEAAGRGEAAAGQSTGSQPCLDPSVSPSLLPSQLSPTWNIQSLRQKENKKKATF